MTKIQEIALSKDEVLLVGGPAAIKVLEGEVEVLGWRPAHDKVIVIRKSKIIPVETYSSAKIGLLTQSGIIMKVGKDKAGTSLWREHFSNIDLKQFKKILIIGDTDSGKTTISTFLVNCYISHVGSVAVLDSDVGQNDLVPPGYVGLSTIKHPVVDLRDVAPQYLKYYGDTRPSTHPDRLNEIICELSKLVDTHLIINTDGYVRDEGLKIKKKLIEKMKPDLIISLGVRIDNYNNSKMIVVPPVKGLTKTKMDRKERRELQYLSFLKKMHYKLSIDLREKQTYIFGSRIQLKILNNIEKNLLLIRGEVGEIGVNDLLGLFISLEDQEGKEHAGWIKSVSDRGVTILTLSDISSTQVQKIHLGLVRYYGREMILNFLRGVDSAKDITTLSFNQKGSS